MGSENKSWKEKVQTESVWIPSSELRWIPDIIVQKYEELRKIIVVTRIRQSCVQRILLKFPYGFLPLWASL